METRQKRENASHHARRKATGRKPKADAHVVYTQPKPFNRNRFLLRLVTVIAVVLALTFGLSIFFKVDKDAITVSGAEKYKPEQVVAASGIQDGENLLTLSEPGISGKIITQLPYILRVRVGIKLPDTVNIEVTELDIAYAIEDREGSWWLMAADGKLVDRINSAAAKKYTRVLGVQLADCVIGQQAVAAEQEQSTETTTDATEESVAAMPTVAEARGSDRLAAAVTILQQLEANGVIGDVTDVDVTNLNTLQLQYEDRFLVSLGDSARMDYKISCLKAAVEQMEDYESGELDVSFTVRPDQVVYTPQQ